MWEKFIQWIANKQLSDAYTAGWQDGYEAYEQQNIDSIYGAMDDAAAQGYEEARRDYGYYCD